MHIWRENEINAWEGDRKSSIFILCSHFYNICHIIIEFDEWYWIESVFIPSSSLCAFRFLFMFVSQKYFIISVIVTARCYHCLEPNFIWIFIDGVFFLSCHTFRILNQLKACIAFTLAVSLFLWIKQIFKLKCEFDLTDGKKSNSAKWQSFTLNIYFIWISCGWKKAIICNYLIE